MPFGASLDGRFSCKEAAAVLKALAVIPARGGSKGLPRKNVRPMCGKPLILWTIEAAQRSESVGRVVVSTDDPEIAAVSRQSGAEVVWRPESLSDDTASSESALLHALKELNVDRGLLVFLQCTAPLMLPTDIDAAVSALEEADSAFTATEWHRFAWKQTLQGAVPVGHDRAHRLRRQDLSAQFLEVGAVYAMKIDGFLKAQSRFFGRTGIVPIPAGRSLEIDDETDFMLVERLLRRRLGRERRAQLPLRVEALVMDFDGVLTDNRVHVDEEGKESVVCHRGDGWAIQRLKEAGIRLMVLTNESNPSVKRRLEKLSVECIVTTSKLPSLKEWLNHHGVRSDATIYVGNDAPDRECMLYVACGVAPADAYPSAKEAAQVLLNVPGGQGCIRELAGMLLPELGGV